MATLNRNLTTPQNAGFDYPDALSGTLTSTAFVTASIVQTLEGYASNTIVLEGTILNTISGELITSGSLEGTLALTLQGSLFGLTTLEGSLDSDVLEGVLINTATITLNSSVITVDMSGAASNNAYVLGSLVPHLEATLPVESYFSGYLAEQLGGRVINQTTLYGEIVETLKGSLNVTTVLDGGIDTPDYISGELTVTGTFVGTMVNTLSGSLVSQSYLSGFSILTFAADLSGEGSGITTFDGDLFLSIDPSMAGVLTGQAATEASLQQATSALHGLKNIKLVDVIRR